MGEPRLFKDTYNAVLDDDLVFGVIWGKGRCSKTTLAGWIMHNIFNNDWNKVLEAFSFNLTQFMDRIELGIPERVWTRNGLHNRLPAVTWDDFGSSANKAVTQYDQAFDLLKGGYDVLGTGVANIWLTMIDPTEITYQLMIKYNAEVHVTEKGKYKYDQIDFQQDYKGWKPKIRKIPIETNTFDPWPKDVYAEYDQMRMALVPDVFQRIRDAQALNNVEIALKLIRPCDIELLRLIENKGPIYSTYNAAELGINIKDAINKCKGRSLIVPLRKSSGYYKYDLTNIGLEVLAALNKNPELEKEVAQKYSKKS